MTQSAETKRLIAVYMDTVDKRRLAQKNEKHWAMKLAESLMSDGDVVVEVTSSIEIGGVTAAMTPVIPQPSNQAPVKRERTNPFILYGGRLGWRFRLCTKIF